MLTCAGRTDVSDKTRVPTSKTADIKHHRDPTLLPSHEHCETLGTVCSQAFQNLPAKHCQHYNCTHTSPAILASPTLSRGVIKINHYKCFGPLDLHSCQFW